MLLGYNFYCFELLPIIITSKISQFNHDHDILKQIKIKQKSSIFQSLLKFLRS